MARVYPFKAILYRSTDNGDVTDSIAPPYDVINGAAREMYAMRSDTNIVRLVLPDGEGDRKYLAASDQFEAWLADEILTESAEESMFVWEQTFEAEGKSYNRRALVAKVACGAYAQGEVMGHELTHASIKADRLKLFQATNVQFSQLFALFDDPGNRVQAHLLAASKGTPDQVARAEDGHLSKLYRISDPAVIADLQSAFASQTIVIADGHHRYETTAAYFEALGRPGHALMTLVPSDDPGNFVLPTHRVTALDLSSDEFVSAASEVFETVKAPFAGWESLHAEQLASGKTILAISPTEDVAFVLTSRTQNSESDLGAVGQLHGELLPLLAARSPQTNLELFDYHRDASDAIAAAAASGGWAFLLPPVEPAQLLAVAERGGVFPQKSTYFFPKFLSGFVSSRFTEL